jgi:DNA-binding NtrC family response regulator
MQQQTQVEAEGRDRSKDLRSLLDDYERKLILLALDAAAGHQRRAAASLGILPSTLSEKMKRLGLRTPARGWSAPAPDLVVDRVS